MLSYSPNTTPTNHCVGPTTKHKIKSSFARNRFCTTHTRVLKWIALHAIQVSDTEHTTNSLQYDGLIQQTVYSMSIQQTVQYDGLIQQTVYSMMVCIQQTDSIMVWECWEGLSSYSLDLFVVCNTVGNIVCRYGNIMVCLCMLWVILYVGNIMVCLCMHVDYD